MTDLFAFGIGLSTTNPAGDVLETYFPYPMLRPAPALVPILDKLSTTSERRIEPVGVAELAQALAGDAQREPDLVALKALAEADRPLTAVRLETDAPIASTAAAYLKLHLLSHRLALPNSLNLDGIFAHLPTLAWTNQGPIEPDALPAAMAQARLTGRPLHVRSLDKFPQMVDYVIPSGVRIANAARVRLGAYVGDGTTVMHEGQINFNSGSIGPNMVEGRISQGVILGANTDLGGSASTMGTLSGGGQITISIGEHCLIGANAGTGIPLGDRCTIEAGLYITAGTRVTVMDADGDATVQVKARELAGQSDLLFIRHSATGQIQCRTNRSAIELNDALHAHN